MDTKRFDRQIRFFGREGQERIEKAQVGIIGLGGLGSHIAQQLAYLGTRMFRLIDGDTVDQSNLNRLIGATPADAEAERSKVAVAERLIRSVTPDADVQSLADSFVCDAGVALARRCDYVFGGLDSDPARFVLNEVCQAFSIPYLDIATDVAHREEDDGGPLRFGGRMLYSSGGEMCVVCKEVLDPKAVRLGLSTESQRREEEEIYGVPRGDLGSAGPAVVSLNGVLASVAVTEFMAEVTGLRPARRHLEYHGDRGILTQDRSSPRADCYYCKGIYGSGSFDLSSYRHLVK